MEFGEFMGLAAVVIGTVSIVGILTGAYKSKLKVRERELELQILHASGQAGTSSSPDPRIEQRLRVLERIATDKGPDLAAQIEDLRNARQNEVV
ncbi:hypothetical protein B0I00_3357 [Novosphingobium kunmingense]|uniref:Phage shock protein B n=1 Tax=Novosphingobium kunmingense TaxID=1211806 RepID=A0A2N0H325_9SPHN|nr:hypothetical protein [Novosphingobium kunmingense]PKB13319.1 hypothetical protein B0I00_3357 [Novosphingobium kunmingense]